MNLKVNGQGNIEINPYDLFAELDEEQQEEIVKGLAWETKIWAELKDAICNDYGGDDIQKIRLAFLQGDNIVWNIKVAIEKLLGTIKTLQADKEEYRKRYYEWVTWWQQRNPDKDWPVDHTYVPTQYANRKDVDAILAALGITDEQLEQPMEVKSE